MSRATVALVVAVVFFAMSWAQPDPITSLVWFACALIWVRIAYREARP